MSLTTGESTALSPLPLISSYKSEKSSCGTGETIVQYIGGQSFAQGSLAAEALRPAHDISLALELGLPETICGDVETLQTWAALSNPLQQHRLYGVAGTQETEAKLSEQLKTEWSSTAKALHLESESVEKAHERVAAVGECVREFLQLLQEHTKADSSSGKVAECTAYLIEPFCEAGKDGKQRLLATVLLDVQTTPGLSLSLSLSVSLSLSLTD